MQERANSYNLSLHDEVLVSSSRIHSLVFTLPAGARFRHSEQNRTVFACDEVYLVLEGTLVLTEPERGEVVRAEAGEAAKSINTASAARGLNNRIISASLPSRLHQPPISLSMRRSGMNQMAATAM